MKSDSNNTALIVVLVILVVFLFGGFGMMSFGGNSWMYQMMGNYWYGGWIFGFLFNILALVALILFVVWLIRKLGEQK